MIDRNFLREIIFFFLSCVSLVQVIFILLFREKLLLPPVIFDLLFLVIAIFLLGQLKSARGTDLGVLFFGSCFVFYWLVASIAANVDLYLVLLELKPLFSLLLLFSIYCLGPNLYVQRKSPMFKVFIALYLISIVLQYFLPMNIKGMRPFVYIENNFESVLIMVSALKVFGARFSLSAYATLIGSLSSLVSALFVGTFFNPSRVAQKIVVLGVFALLLFFLVLAFRQVNVEDVDRVFFLRMTLLDLSQRDFVQIIFGSNGVSELKVLSSECSKLLFYDVLGSGICSPVLTHTFWTRIILNFGLLGVLLSSVIMFRMMRASHFNFLLVGIVAINGLSVSSVSSGIIALTVALFMDGRAQSYVSKN